jgi:hypothetical protein
MSSRYLRRNVFAALLLAWAQAVAPLAQAADCGNTPKFSRERIGMNALTIQQFSNDSGVLDALHELGVQRVRTAFFWGIIQRQNGNFRWQDIVDPGINAVRTFNKKYPEAQLQILGLLNGPTPCWALPDTAECKNGMASVPPSCDQSQNPASCPWYQFVYATVSRYKDTIHYWEVWNEPNLYQALSISTQGCDSRLTRQTPACAHLRMKSYVANILVPAEKAIRAADPTAKIVAPALAGINTGGAQTPSDLKNILREVLGNPQAAKDIDVISLHVYPPNFPLVEDGKAVRALLNSGAVNKPGTPIWLSETGARWKSQGDNTATGQASFLNGEFLQALEARNPYDPTQPLYQTVLWYQLLDSGGTGAYGLFASTAKADKGYERQSFKTIQCMIGIPPS